MFSIIRVLLVLGLSSDWAGYWRCAASAASASALTPAKKSGDCPSNRPMAVRNFAAPMAAPSVLVGRMIEQLGNLRSRNFVGSGMSRFGLYSDPGTFRSGNVSPVVGSVSGGELPPMSCHVWQSLV